MKNRRPMHRIGAIQMRGAARCELMTVSEFAAALTVTPACVRRWILQRKVAIVKLGRLVRIPVSEIERMVGDGLRPAANGAR